MAIYTDQIGQQHNFKKTPKRIISLIPCQTELLFDLGLEDELIGITNLCVNPFHLKSVKEIIKDSDKIHFEKIKLLNPDIIITNKDNFSAELLDHFKNVCPIWITDVKTFEDNTQLISDFGSLFNRRIEAQKWIDKIDFSQKNFMKYVSDKEIKKVAYFISSDPYTVAGDHTFINQLLKINRFENVYAVREESYPEIELRKIRIQGDPEMVFLPSEPFPFTEENAFEIGRFTHHGITIFVDGKMFSWYGTHLVKAFDYFKQIHERL